MNRSSDPSEAELDAIWERIRINEIERKDLESEKLRVWSKVMQARAKG